MRAVLVRLEVVASEVGWLGWSGIIACRPTFILVSLRYFRLFCHPCSLCPCGCLASLIGGLIDNCIKRCYRLG
jgi:hypothetical protein